MYNFAREVQPGGVAFVLDGVDVDGVIGEVVLEGSLHELVQSLTVEIVGEENGNLLK
jgi:hypothetical protein